MNSFRKIAFLVFQLALTCLRAQMCLGKRSQRLRTQISPCVWQWGGLPSYRKYQSLTCTSTSSKREKHLTIRFSSFFYPAFQKNLKLFTGFADEVLVHLRQFRYFLSLFR